MIKENRPAPNCKPIDDKPRITVIGGGTGLPILIEGLKNAACEVTAVVTVADDGGSSGSIRSAINTIPPGDIRNCIIALSDMPNVYKDIFQYRFAPDDQEFSGHAIGNLIIAALAEMRGDVYHALRLLSVMMQLKGEVLPAAEEPLVLQAYYPNGECIEGETTIVDMRRPIDHVSVRLSDDLEGKKSPKAGRQVVKRILTSDLIVLGPGSLYTSILPNICIPEIREALIKTQAPILYVCNIMTQLGETEHFSDADHVRVINEHIGQKVLDAILINDAPVPEAYVENSLTPEYLVQVANDDLALAKEVKQVVKTDFLDLKPSGVYHDQRKLVRAITRFYHRLPQENV